MEKDFDFLRVSQCVLCVSQCKFLNWFYCSTQSQIIATFAVILSELCG